MLIQRLFDNISMIFNIFSEYIYMYSKLLSSHEENTCIDEIQQLEVDDIILKNWNLSSIWFNIFKISMLYSKMTYETIKFLQMIIP